MYIFTYINNLHEIVKLGVMLLPPNATDVLTKPQCQA